MQGEVGKTPPPQRPRGPGPPCLPHHCRPALSCERKKELQPQLLTLGPRPYRGPGSPTWDETQLRCLKVGLPGRGDGRTGEVMGRTHCGEHGGTHRIAKVPLTLIQCYMSYTGI